MTERTPDQYGPSARQCPGCAASIAEERARFCPMCGLLLEEPASDSHGEVAIVRHRLGGRTETVAHLASSHAGGMSSPLSDEYRHDFVPAPGTDALTNPPVRKKRRRRRPLYRRPLFIVPLVLCAIIFSVASAALFRVESTLNSVHQVSTIPPVITDSTYNDPGSADPNEPAVPPQVNTGPAQAALDASAGARSFNVGSGGFTSRLSNAFDNTADLARGAMAAAGPGQDAGQPMTLLVMGVDARPGAAIDIGVRPDAFMLVRLDPVSNSCRVLSVPRDTRVTLPGYGESKINHALMVGGISYELLVAQQYLGIPIDHYLLVDFQAFKQMVDSAGGITVTVPADLVKDGVRRYTAGPHAFDGEQTLAYARYRAVPDGDAGRVQRQWSILLALAKASANRSAVTEVNTLLPQLESHLRTDLSAEQMVSMAATYGDACRQTKSSSITMLDGTRVQLSDPILGQSAYFNVVSEETKSARITEFLADTPVPSNGPATPVPELPVITPVTSPAASGSPGSSKEEQPIRS